MSIFRESFEKQTNRDLHKDVENSNSATESLPEDDKSTQKRVSKKIGSQTNRSVAIATGGIQSGLLKCGLFIDSTLRRIHQPFRLILGLAAIGKPVGILLLMLFATVVTTFLYWGVNTYVLNYDHCFEPKATVDMGAVKFLSTKVSKSPKEFKTESFEKSDPASYYSITINDEKKYCCVYHIAKDELQLFSVKMERKDDSLYLKLLYTDEKSNEQEINWYSMNNIASTNEVLRIQTKTKAIRSPVFPTNTGAFISWLREYGKDHIPTLKKVSFTEDDWNLAITGELERHFENEWYFNDKTYWFLIVARSFNGTIQFLSVVLFVAALMCLYARNVLLVCHLAAKKDRIRIASGEQLPFTEVKEKDFHNWLKREYDSAVKAQTVFRRAWGCDSSQLFVWEHGLLLFMESDTPHISTLNEIANVQKENLENSRSFVYWLLDSIPALGFVGTVIGISQTMMNTSSVLSNELGKQQSRISEVSMNLAFAFDTTLIALVLALIASFFMAYCIRRENDALNKTQELLIRILNENT